MTILQAFILGLVQGLTEFIPVSSSGHLIIIPSFFRWPVHSLVFDTTLHLGTSLALVVYFFNDLKKIVISTLSDFFQYLNAKNKKVYKISHLQKDTLVGFNIILATIPALILGLLLNDYFEITFRSAHWVALFIILGSILMFFAEFLYSKVQKNKISILNKLDVKNSLLIGFFQSLALFPGFSRSGSTISAGMLLGLSKEDSARFSFLLSLPIILSAGIFQLLSSSWSDYLSYSTLIGFLFSFVFGLIAIKFLLSFLKTNKLYIFVIYRIMLGVLITFYI